MWGWRPGRGGARVPRPVGADRRADRRSTRKRLRHPSIGWLTLDCDALHDPATDHWIILYTATPGTPDHDALRLLNVIGTQDLTAHQ
jgi:hypothetical protein